MVSDLNVDFRSLTPKRKREYKRDHPYMDFTVPDLRGIAHQRQLSVTTNMPKTHLVSFLEIADESAAFKFLDLPPEVRNMVYLLAFSEVGPIRLQCSYTLCPNHRRSRFSLLSIKRSECNCAFRGDGHGNQDPRRSLQSQYADPPITRTCKQIRSEGLPLFYATRRFPIYLARIPSSATRQSLQWVANLRQEHFRDLRRFCIALGSRTHLHANISKDLQLVSTQLAVNDDEHRRGYGRFEGPIDKINNEVRHCRPGTRHALVALIDGLQALYSEARHETVSARNDISRVIAAACATLP